MKSSTTPDFWTNYRKLSPDGQRFLFVENATFARMRSLVVVLNWTEELKRLVPMPRP